MKIPTLQILELRVQENNSLIVCDLGYNISLEFLSAACITWHFLQVGFIVNWNKKILKKKF